MLPDRGHIRREQPQAIAAFFDLDKTIISRSSALAFAPLFYRHGLISRLQVARSAVAQASFRLSGAGPQQLERIRDQVSALCSGWPAEKVAHLVAAHLEQVIGPLVYSEARRLLASHRQAGHDVIIVSTSGHEIVGPIGTMLGVTDVIATRMSVTDGHYTGSVEFYAYGQAKADHVRTLAASRGYLLPDCYAYSDSATDLPLLELVGHPRVVNPDRALRRVARVRNWPQLSFRLAGLTDEAAAAATRAAESQLGAPSAGC